jgi:rod shape-determining protein MreC
LKKAHYIALGTVLGLTVVLLLMPERAMSRFKLAIGSVFVPLFGLSGSARQAAGKAREAVLPRPGLPAENEQLRRENAELKLRLLQAEAAFRENERLHALAGWSRAKDWKFFPPARVIARDPANWWRNIYIDRGHRDGLRPDLAVVSAEGLVGRVVEVSQTHARVALLGDPNCRVGAMVIKGRVAVDTGVIASGSSIVDPSFVDLTYLSRTSGVEPGQMVVTSGLGGVFPKGLPIGQLVDTRSIEYGLYTEARVKLAANLNRLEEVLVMMP